MSMDLDAGEEDPELAAAIEASFRTQQNLGGMSEDDMMAQALRLSRLEGEDRDETMDAADAAAIEQALREELDLDALRASSHAAGAASSSSSQHPAAAPQRTRWSRRSIGDEDDNASDFAVAGGSSRGSSVGPGGFQRFPEDLEGSFEQDPHLAAAIEASYRAQTEQGRLGAEDDLLEQALKISRMEEESRQRAYLKQQQDAELQESILMDQMREQEEKRRKVEEEELQTRAQEEARRQQQEQALKRERLPPEPPAGEPGRVNFQIRLPDGRRLQRAFRGSDVLGAVYDYVDVEGLSTDESVRRAYALVSTMPRREYLDRALTLAEAGLQGQCALLVEWRAD